MNNKNTDYYYDKVDWHFDDALSMYCDRFNCKIDEDNEQNDKYIEAAIMYAATHIGMFLAWIIKNNFIGHIHKCDSVQALEKVRNGEMTGTHFLLENCGGKLLGIDLNDEGNEFANCYYEYYLSDYADLVLCKGKGIYEVEDNWNNYQYISDMIDEAYKNFREGIIGNVR